MHEYFLEIASFRYFKELKRKLQTAALLLALAISGLEPLMAPAHRRLGKLPAFADFPDKLRIPVFPFIPLQGPVYIFIIFYLDNQHYESSFRKG